MKVNLSLIVLFSLLFFALVERSSSGTDESSNLMEHPDLPADCADRKLVRPSPKERVAVIKLLEQKPRPKTFIDADIKYLRALLEKAVWTGSERRIVEDIRQEAMSQGLDVPDPGAHQ